MDANFSFDAMDEPGNLVSLIHEPLDINSKVRIVGMTQLLSSPAEGSIEIESEVKSLTDIFRGIINRM